MATERAVIINLSALATPEVSISGLAYYPLRLLGKDGPTHWPSIQKYLALCSRYSNVSKYACMEICKPAFNLPWLIRVYLVQQRQLITKYKSGKLTTDNFLTAMLNIFSFLKTAEFENSDLQRVFDIKRKLTSIQHVESLEELNANTVLAAKALLEEAWIARIQFSAATAAKVQSFFDDNFDDNKDKRIFIVSNTNEMDALATFSYLCETYPGIQWCSKQELIERLKLPDTGLEHGIVLDKSGKVIFYASYTHSGSYKTGIIPETGASTASLVERIISDNHLVPESVKLISQWEQDLIKGRELNFGKVISANDYFTPSESKKMQ